MGGLAAANPSSILDHAFGQIHDRRDVSAGMDRLVNSLESLRQSLPRYDWADVCTSLCRQHRLLDVVHQDPLTALTYTRAAERAPDSVFLSFAYNALEAELSLGHATDLGREICAYTRQSQVVLATRRRREVLAYLIDQFAGSGRRPSVLAFGCGDLKEADLSKAVREGGLTRFLSIVESEGARQNLDMRLGHLGVATRNHYTEADWNISNGWLVEDFTAKLAGDTAVKFSETIDRSKFLKSRYGLTVSIPIEMHEDVYLPYEQIERAKSQLQDGDFVNVVRATVKKDAPPNEIFGGSAFVGHVGLIGHGPNGEVHMIHSSEPRVREEPIDEYIARSTKDLAAKDAAGKPRLVGFKFLRLRDQPLKNLQKIDGADAPRVTLPSGEEAKL